LFERIQNALAGGQWYLGLGLAFVAGVRDENKLTNMVFFARHPERRGRKLDKNAPDFEPLSREWLVIRNTIIRPFLAKTSPATPVTTQPTRPVAGGKPYPEVNTPLLPSGPGFIRQHAESRSYGLPETIRALQEIAADWHSAHPQGPRIRIHDISRQGGGELKPHKSHQVGLDVDITLEGRKASWFNKQGQKINNRYRWEPNSAYSRSLTADLVRLILDHPKGGLKIKFILFDDPEIRSISSKVVKDKSSPHLDHLHARFCAPPYFAAKVDKRFTSCT
jgi:hypothetical protein